MRVQHNIPAMNSYRNYNNNAKAINKNLEKLSSGYRINRAGDDAAGLAISEKMRAQVTGLEVAQKNAKDGISLVQTAEGALTEVHSMLNRMYALAEQAGNGTYDNSVDRNQLNKEVEKLRQEIDRIGETTNFNGTKLFSGNPEVAVSGITDVSATLQSADASFNDMEVEIAEITNNAGTKQFQVVAPTGYQFANAAGELLGIENNNTVVMTDGSTATPMTTGLFEDPAAKETIYLVNQADTTKTATIDLDFSKFNPDTDVTNGTMKLTVPADGLSDASATLQSAGPNTARLQAPTTVSLTGTGIDLWVGDFPDDNNKINIALGNINSETLVIGTDTVNLSTQQGALNSLSYIKDAIDKVSDLRGTLGAAQNRLEHTINNLSVMQENIQDAESTIRDTDVAEEMMKYTKNSILVQSAQAMLAQANQQPQSVLQLLQ